MKEQDIRPKDLKEKSNALLKEDFERFFGNHENFVQVDCPACRSSKCKKEFQKGGFNFCRCENCETLFVSPRPGQKQLSDFYSQAKSVIFWSKHVFPATENIRMKNIFMPRVELIKRILGSFGYSRPKFLVDVGAGYGSFLEAAKNMNLAEKYLAIEPAVESASKCRQRGFRVEQKMIEDVDLRGEADLIVNFELIEHLFDPSVFLKACFNALNHNGLLLFTTPNIKGFDLAVLGALSDNVLAPIHLNYFHPESLKLLFEKEGFKVLGILTPGKLDVDIVKNKISQGILRAEDLPFLGRLIVENKDGFNEKFQEFLRVNGLSSNMLVVARKK